MQAQFSTSLPMRSHVFLQSVNVKSKVQERWAAEQGYCSNMHTKG